MPQHNLTQIEFFAKHGSGSYNLATETPEQCDERVGRVLADAEAAGRDRGYTYEWIRDQYDNWMCQCRDRHGIPITCTDTMRFDNDDGDEEFAEENEPWNSAARRVLEAELALEAITGNLKALDAVYLPKGESRQQTGIFGGQLTLDMF